MDNDKENCGDRILLYIDLLGIKESMSNHEQYEIVKEIILLFSNSTQSEITHIHSTDRSVLSSYEPEVSNFSDHILFSMKFDNDPLKIVYQISKLTGYIINIFMFTLKRGFLIRGAIVAENLYHVGNSVFGLALINAYKIEAEVAIYPRVIVSANLIEIIAKNRQTMKILEQTKCIAQDFDGMYFINWMSCMLSKEALDENFFSDTKKIVDSNLLKFEKNYKIFAKWKWLHIKLLEAFHRL